MEKRQKILRFLMLSVQAQRLNAAATAIALKSLGKEPERKGQKQQAVSFLEEARDVSPGASKRVIAFVHSYLSRGSARDALRFERAINTGLTIASSLDEAEEDGMDFVYAWSPVSAMLAEQSWGYLELGEPTKTLAMGEEMERQITRGQDTRLHAWIPLDWARAHLMLGDIESCIKEARSFYPRASAMRSPMPSAKRESLSSRLRRQGIVTYKLSKTSVRSYMRQDSANLVEINRGRMK